MEVDDSLVAVAKTKKRKSCEEDKAKKLSASLFRVNGDSEGGLVKSRNEVVKTRVEKCGGAQPHVNCRVQTFGLIMKQFNEMKVKWVEELGMGGLLHLVGKNLPRGLCYWLMTKVDPLKRVFIFPSGLEYPLDRSQVHWVLGLPYGPKLVPCDARSAVMLDFVEKVYEKYGIRTKCGTRYVSISKVMDRVEGECAVEHEMEFKEAFLALALSDVLCPTTCLRLSKDLIPALSVVGEAHGYDWCSLVLEKLFVSSRSFCEKFYKDGFAKGVGGCTYILAIFYLDHLNRTPVRWGVFPRVKAWNEADVQEAKNADRLFEGTCSDYGKLECVDVAYGERHPLAARDTMGPAKCQSEVLRELIDGVRGFDQVYGGWCQGGCKDKNGVEHRRSKKGRGGRRKGPPDGSNPFERKIAKKVREQELVSNKNECTNTMMVVVPDVGDDVMEELWIGAEADHVVDGEEVFEAGQNSIGMDEVDTLVNDVAGFGYYDAEPGGGQVSGSNYLWRVDMRDEACDLQSEDVSKNLGSILPENEEGNDVVREKSVFESEVEDVLDGKMCRSKPRRGTKPSATISDLQFDVEVVPRKNCKLKRKLVNYVCTAGAIIKDEALLEASEKTQEDVILLKVGEMFASVMNCYSVAEAMHGGVDDNYVRVAAVLYRRRWKKRFGDSGSRYMLDPTYALRAFQEIGPPSGWNDCRRLANVYVKDFSRRNTDRVHVIFVPVLENRHWWCAAYCLNSEEVWVIDSLSKDPLDCHASSLWKLSHALDIFLCALDFTWMPGKLESWPRRDVNMEQQSDETSCGVRMLLAIKACAHRYTSQFRLQGTIDEERGWLLTDDLLDDENEVKENVKQLVTEFEV